MVKDLRGVWPAHVGNDPFKRQDHLRPYKAKESIELNCHSTEKNPGKHSFAKMMLNSMWGKFGQCMNKTQIKEFEDPLKVSAFHNSDANDICYVSVLSEDIVGIHYKLKSNDNLSRQPSTFLSLVSRHVGLDFICMQLWICHKTEYCTQTPTALYFPVSPLADFLSDFKDE